MPDSKGNLYTFKFMACVCLACSLLVSAAATALKSTQERNQRVDIQQNILTVLGIIEPGEKPSSETTVELFSQVNLMVVNGKGEKVDFDGEISPKFLETLPKKIDQVQKLREQGNSAKIEELQEQLLLPVYTLPGENEGSFGKLCIPIAGRGLWSTLYGYLALEGNGKTIAGITFYKHGETPGLGGEIDNPQWKSQFPGKSLDPSAEVPLSVLKPGRATEQMNHAVDGISGATITSNSVQQLIKKDLEAYRPFFENNVWNKGG